MSVRPSVLQILKQLRLFRSQFIAGKTSPNDVKKKFLNASETYEVRKVYSRRGISDKDKTNMQFM